MEPISKRLPGVVVIAIFLTLAAQGQQVATRQHYAVEHAAPTMTASLSGSPMEAGVTKVSAADSDLAVSSGAVLPLTPQPVLKPTGIHPENHPTQQEVRVWKTLLIAQHSAAAFDAWTTRRSLESGNGFERNVLMRPFADSAAIYPALQVAPLAFDYLSHRMMRSDNRFFRNTWWVPQVASTSASLWCGSRNLRVADFKR